MDWIDGETMESYIAENYQDNFAMAMLCYRFSKMAAWLRSQPFAHGDIKPDNIMVRPDGSLTLIDYDGMFVSCALRVISLQQLVQRTFLILCELLMILMKTLTTSLWQALPCR